MAMSMTAFILVKLPSILIVRLVKILGLLISLIFGYSFMQFFKSKDLKRESKV